jgi:photosystem II stability/assembly factor-like uncharacterized protein
VGAKLSVSIGAIWATGVLFGASPVLAAPGFVGNTGWSWGNPAPQGNTLNEVVFVGAQGFAVGEKGTVLRSEDGGEDWLPVLQHRAGRLRADQPRTRRQRAVEN